MSYNFNKFNRVNGVRPEDLDTEEFEYTKLSDYCGDTIAVRGFFFTNGDFGKQVVIITDECFINMPARAVGDFEDIANDPDAKAAVLDGELVITDIEKVKTKRGKDTTAYKLANSSDVTGKKKNK